MKSKSLESKDTMIIPDLWINRSNFLKHPKCYTVEFKNIFSDRRGYYGISVYGSTQNLSQVYFSIIEYMLIFNAIWNINLGECENSAQYIGIVNDRLQDYRNRKNLENLKDTYSILHTLLVDKGIVSPNSKVRTIKYSDRWGESLENHIVNKCFLDDVLILRLTFSQKSFMAIVEM